MLAQSSNIGTIEVAQALGKDRLLAQIGNLGFGKPTGLAFPGESHGLVPGPAAWTGTSIGWTPKLTARNVIPMKSTPRMTAMMASVAAAFFAVQVC